MLQVLLNKKVDGLGDIPPDICCRFVVVRHIMRIYFEVAEYLHFHT